MHVFWEIIDPNILITHQSICDEVLLITQFGALELETRNEPHLLNTLTDEQVGLIST